MSSLTIVSSVFIVVRRTTKTFGHGDFGEVVELGAPASYGKLEPYPAFTSREGTEAFIGSLGTGSYGLQAIEVPLHT